MASSPLSGSGEGFSDGRCAWIRCWPSKRQRIEFDGPVNQILGAMYLGLWALISEGPRARKKLAIFLLCGRTSGSLRSKITVRSNFLF